MAIQGLDTKKSLSFKEGKLVVQLSATFDGDKDGVVAAEAGMYANVDAVEAVKEIVNAQHIPTLQTLLPIFKGAIGMVPEVAA